MIIRSKSDLLSLQKKAPASRLVLYLPGLSSEENRSWTTKLNRYKSPCGCRAAAAGLIITSGFFWLFLFLRNKDMVPYLKINWIWILSIICLVTIIAKWIGKKREKEIFQKITQYLADITDQDSQSSLHTGN